MRFVGVDPATTTGFVALDPNGNVLLEKVLNSKGSTKGAITIKQLVELENLLYRELQKFDEVVIEDASPGTQKVITTGMIHGGLRSMIVRQGLSFNIVSPNAVKKFVGVTGFKGEVGKKVKLEDGEKKEAMRIAVIEHFNYTHPRHDVIDAYVMARIAMNLYYKRELLPMIDTLPYQREVIETILEKSLA